MDIDITIPLSLEFFLCTEKLFVQLCVQAVVAQGPLRGNQGLFVVGIGTVPDIPDLLVFLVDLVHHLGKLYFIIPVILI